MYLKNTRQLVGIRASSEYILPAETLKTRISPNIKRREAMVDVYRDQQRMSLVFEEGDPRPLTIAVLLRLPAPNLSHVYVGGRDGPFIAIFSGTL